MEAAVGAMTSMGTLGCGASLKASCSLKQSNPSLRRVGSIGTVQRQRVQGGPSLARSFEEKRASKRRVSRTFAMSGEPGTEAPPEVYVDPKRALKEEFTTVNTGRHECQSCGYVYDKNVGDAIYPVARGTTFEQLPEDWACPTCGAAQEFFKSQGVLVAGFAENQNYGLGGNSLTTGQKSILIYGALGAFFMMFLSGYLLQ